MPPKKKVTKPAASKKPAANSAPTKQPTSATAAAEDKKSPEKPAGETCALATVAKILLDGESDKLKDSGRWPFVVDPSEKVAVFLRYRNANCLCTLNSQDMEVDRLRLALMGSIRFGKPFVIDMMDTDMFPILTERFEKIQPGLMDDVMNKKILKDEKYMDLVRSTDASDYQPDNFDHSRFEDFSFILLAKKDPSPELAPLVYVVKVQN